RMQINDQNFFPLLNFLPLSFYSLLVARSSDLLTKEVLLLSFHRRSFALTSLSSLQSRDDELISPCMCKGAQQFVHHSCLDHLRSVKDGFSFSHCTTCKAQFHLRDELFEDNSWRKLMFRLFVVRDVLLVFLAVQTASRASLSFLRIIYTS
ncbi:hypothetical protein Ancab_024173, partial [Ancistrocladus abbreviatus]